MFCAGTETFQNFYGSTLYIHCEFLVIVIKEHQLRNAAHTLCLRVISDHGKLPAPVGVGHGARDVVQDDHHEVPGQTESGRLMLPLSPAPGCLSR